MTLSSRRSWCVCLAALAAAGLVGLHISNRAQAADEAKASPSRVAQTRHIMAGIHGPSSSALRALLRNGGPADDGAWEEVAAHAALLNESGHLLMQHGRCPDAIWADATENLREGTSNLYRAARQKDISRAREALTVVNTSCQSCHDKHRQPAPAAPAVPASPAPASPQEAAPPAAVADPPAAPAEQAGERSEDPAADKAPPVPPVEPATPEPGPQARLAQVRHLMAGINAPAARSLGESLKGDGPGDESAWLDVVRYAALLNEMSFLLMQNNRCPDQIWESACSSLREHSASVAHAGQTRNLEDARSGLKSIAAACAACHAVHKKPPF